MNVRTDENEIQFKRMLVISLAFHAAIVLVFTIQTLIFPTDNIEFHPAIRVDLVGLPQKRKEPAPVPAPEEKKVEVPAPKIEKPVEKPKEIKIDNSKARTDAIRKLKNMQALENLKKNKEAESEKKTEKAVPQYKGNVISPGTALRGLDKLNYDDYLSAVHGHVHKNWNLPEWLKRLDLKAIAFVKVDKNGYVIEKGFRQPSGNLEFDRLVIETIEMSSPFPAPPDKMQALVGIDGITLGFPE